MRLAVLPPSLAQSFTPSNPQPMDEFRSEEEYAPDYGDTRHKMRGTKFSERKLVKKTHNTKYMRELAFQLEKRKKQSEDARSHFSHVGVSVKDDFKLDRKDLKAEKRKEARAEKKAKKGKKKGMDEE